MSAKTYNLKPCPFCGGKAAFHSRYVACLNIKGCGAMMSPVSTCTEEEAVAAWNRRTADELREGG